jgi:hypothetical protein
MASEPNKTYLCDSSHYQHDVDVPPKHRPLAGTKCPMYWLGSPCKGRLWRVGNGSKAENATAKEKLFQDQLKASVMRATKVNA